MPDRAIRFDPTFFDDLDRLFATERSAHGAPSRMDFLLYDLPPLRDSLAADFAGSTVAMQPGAPARVIIGAGVLCTAIAMWVVLGPDDAVHVVGLNVQLW